MKSIHTTARAILVERLEDIIIQVSNIIILGELGTEHEVILQQKYPEATISIYSLGTALPQTSSADLILSSCNATQYKILLQSLQSINGTLAPNGLILFNCYSQDLAQVEPHKIADTMLQAQLLDPVVDVEHINKYIVVHGHATGKTKSTNIPLESIVRL